MFFGLSTSGIPKSTQSNRDIRKDLLFPNLKAVDANHLALANEVNGQVPKKARLAMTGAGRKRDQTAIAGRIDHRIKVVEQRRQQPRRISVSLQVLKSTKANRLIFVFNNFAFAGDFFDAIGDPCRPLSDRATGQEIIGSLSLEIRQDLPFRRSLLQ